MGCYGDTQQKHLLWPEGQEQRVARAETRGRGKAPRGALMSHASYLIC